MLRSDIIVIGAGASGLVAAICAARKGKKVIILDRMSKAGKKIYATGNGKCNYTNVNYECDSYRGTDTSIADSVLSQFSYLDTIDFFEQLGIMAKNKNGYIYPYSEQASSIVEVLLMELECLGVHIILEEEVIDIRKEEVNVKQNISEYRVITKKSKYVSSKVIMAMGGMASPKLGSDGSGYTIAKKFKHSIIQPNKALVSLKCKGKDFRSISGVRLQASVVLTVENDKKYSNFGEIIFTDYGVSGIPIMQLSRYASVALSENKKVRLEIDFYPEIDDKELLVILKNRKKNSPNKDNYQLLIGMLNSKLAGYIVKKSNDRLETMVKYMKKLIYEVTDTNSWDSAQVTAGGVSTNEINYETMESRLHKGLYIVGELLDIDGTCGGYNLQWAWATGYIAGCHAGK